MSQSLEEFFQDSQEIVIQQLKEWVEVLSNFETTNKYEILNSSENKIGFAAELGGGLGKTILRMWLKSHRPLDLHIYGLSSNELLAIKRPFYFLFSNMTISNSSGEVLGFVRKRFGVLYKKYDLLLENESLFATIKAPRWRLWTFPIFDKSENQVGVISKKWGGMLKEAFTDADRFDVKFPGTSTAIQKAIILGAALSVDLDYFEENVGRS